MTSKEPYNKPPVRVWEYTIDGKWTVLAGKTDADNDRLSLKEASPRDWWFHVRGMPGSHVLLRALPDEEPGKDILKTAAAVAAWLVAKGTDCKRLIPVGFGETKPLVTPEKDDVDKATNRRVSFVNAHINNKPIMGMPADGGGQVAGDPCIK